MGLYNFQPVSMYEPRYSNTIIDLLAHGGQAQAQADLARGAIWGHALENVGNIVASTVAKHQEEKQEQSRAQMVNQVMSQWDGQDPRALYSGLIQAKMKPEDAIKATDGMASFIALQQRGEAQKAQNAKDQAELDQQQEAQRFEHYKRALDGYSVMPLGTRQQLWQHFREGILPDAARFHSIDPSAVPEQWTPDIDKAVLQLNGQLNPEKLTAVAPGHSLMTSTGEIRATAPAAPPKRDIQALDMQTKQPAFVSQQDLEANPGRYQPMRTGVNVNMPAVGGSEADAKETVAGMKEGTLPPQLPGRATKEYVALMAEAHRQGFDLSKANLDWQATSKHVATLNGAQQTRLRQAISTASDSLDVIDNLAKQWQGGRFPMLNKAQLAAAKGGALGKDAQKIATQLEAQITDVVSELGNVYMGGNSPTDHALGLAKQNLSADWSIDQLLSATQLARKNLSIRANSIANAGVAGASENNPYAPTAPAEPTAPKKNPFR